MLQPLNAFFITQRNERQVSLQHIVTCIVLLVQLLKVKAVVAARSPGLISTTLHIPGYLPKSARAFVPTPVSDNSTIFFLLWVHDP